MFSGFLLREMQVITGSEQRFAGDAADVQAGAAEFLVFFDNRGLEPELTRANGADISARPGTNDYDIKFVHNLLQCHSDRRGRICNY